MRCTKTATLVFCLSLWNSYLLSTDLIKGNAQTSSGQSFTFSVQQHCAGRNSFYVAASPTQAGVQPYNEYAVSVLWDGASSFVPLTPQATVINGIAANPNPLYNKAIQYFTVMEISNATIGQTVFSQYPIVVSADDQKTIYLINWPLIADKISMLSVTNINDTTAAPTSGIAGIAAGENSVFAAVKPNVGGNFGDAGSGVALVVKKTEEVTENNVKLTKDVLKYLATTAFTKSSLFLRLTAGADVASLTLSHMWVDAYLGRFYMALEVTAGGAGSGARALVMGYIKNNQIVLQAIAPDAVFTGDNKIVGTGTAGATVSLHSMRTMMTSTWLNYAIVVGANGASGATKNKVYALPLVGDPTSDKLGSLAKFDSDPEDFFVGYGSHMAFNKRYFKTPATVDTDVLRTTDPQARVGGIDAPGDVLDIAVLGDAVVVAVDVAFAPGVTQRKLFASRALFDNKGRINGWTQWRVVASTIGTLAGFSMNGSNGTIIGMENDTPDVDADVKIIRRSAWNFGDADGLGDLNTVLSTEFPQTMGGIQGLYDFSENYNGITNASFLMVTGRKKIALIETSRGNPIIEVDKGNFSANTIVFDNGTVTQNLGGALRVAVIKGGELDTIGALQCAEIADSGTGSTRIFAGGVGGLVALVNPNGSGIAGSLGAGCAGILNGMAFKKIGSYQFVRRLIADSGYLYVLTDSQLDRIYLGDNNFTAVTLATSQTQGGSFLDLIVSGKLAVLATSVGMFRTGNGQDVRTATAVAGVAWTQVVIPEVSGPVQQLIVESQNGLVQNLENGGNLFVLGSYAGKNRGKWSRFTVANFSATDISDTTLQSFPDIFVRSQKDGNILSYFASFGTYRPVLSASSALQLVSRDQDLNKLAMLDMINPFLLSGTRYASTSLHPITSASQGASDINAVLRSSGSGDYLAAMNSGLKVNELCMNTVVADE